MDFKFDNFKEYYYGDPVLLKIKLILLIYKYFILNSIFLYFILHEI